MNIPRAAHNPDDDHGDEVWLAIEATRLIIGVPTIMETPAMRRGLIMKKGLGSRCVRKHIANVWTPPVLVPPLSPSRSRRNEWSQTAHDHDHDDPGDEVGRTS